jgi:hypothetical protein
MGRTLKKLFILALLAAPVLWYLNKEQPAFLRKAAGEKVVGRIVQIQGPRGHSKVVVRGPKAAADAGVGAPLFAGDHVLTDGTQSARIELGDGSLIVLGVDSDLAIDEVLKNDHTTLELLRGLAHALVKKVYGAEGQFVVKTQTAAMGVRGTSFIAKNDQGGLLLATLTGAVAVARAEVDLGKPGASVTAAAGTTTSLVSNMTAPTTPQHFEVQALLSNLAKSDSQFVNTVLTPFTPPEGGVDDAARINHAAPSGPSLSAASGSAPSQALPSEAAVENMLDSFMGAGLTADQRKALLDETQRNIDQRQHQLDQSGSDVK